MSAIISRMTGSSSTTNILRVWLYWFIVGTLFDGSISAWKIKAEDRTFTWNALFEPKSSSHSFDIAAANVKAQAGSTYWGCQRARGAHKLFEDFRLIFRINTFTLITHAHQRYLRIHTIGQQYVINLILW